MNSGQSLPSPSRKTTTSQAGERARTPAPVATGGFSNNAGAGCFGAHGRLIGTAIIDHDDFTWNTSRSYGTDHFCDWFLLIQGRNNDRDEMHVLHTRSLFLIDSHWSGLCRLWVNIALGEHDPPPGTGNIAAG